MKNIISILAIVLISINFVLAQSVFSIHSVRVEGNIQNFEKVQKILSKGAQAAVNNGDILAWLFFEVVKTDGVDDENEYNYVFAQSANNIDQLLDPKFAWWNNSSIVFSKSEQDTLALLSNSFKWTKDERHTYVTEDDLQGGGGQYVQFNFGRPMDVSGFISENKALWKPFFKDNMVKLNMGGWGIARLITLNSSSDAGRATIMTWDVFKSMNDLMKFRIGFTIPKEMQDKSKMGQYMPDGFMFQPIYKVLGYTNAVK